MANETELERLVVRLVGDAVDYQQMLQKSVQDANSAASGIEKALSRIGSQAIMAGAALDQMFGRKIQAIREQGLHGFAEAEAAEFRLVSAMEAHGRNVKVLTEDYKKFAAEMQITTTAEDDAVIAALALAEGMGLTAEKAKLAVKEAQGLAAMKGGGLGSWIQQTAMLGKGSVGRLSRVLGIAGDEMEGASSTEKLAEAHKVLAGFMRVSADETKTYQGQVKQMENEVGNAKEIIGKFVADGWRPLNAAVIEAARWFQALDPEMHQIVATGMSLGANLGSIVSGFGQTALQINSIIQLTKTAADAMKAYGVVNALTMAGTWGLYGATVALGAYLGVTMVNAIVNASGDLDRYNDALKENARLQKLVVGGDQRRISAMLTGMPEGEADRKNALSARLKDAQDKVQQYGVAIRSAQGDVDVLDSWWRRFVGNVKLQEAKTRLDEVRQRSDLWKEAVQNLNDEIQKMAPDAMAAKVKATFDEFMQKQQERMLLTKAATEDEKTLQELRSKGVPEAMVEQAAAMLKENAARDKAIDQRKSLNDEIARQNALLEEEAVTKYNEQLQKGKQLTEEFLTPQEKLIKTKAELDELLGVVGESFRPTYDKALAKARKEAEGVHKAIKGAADSATKFDASIRGSAESLTRWQAMRIEGEAKAAIDDGLRSVSQKGRFFGIKGEETTMGTGAIFPAIPTDLNKLFQDIARGTRTGEFDPIVQASGGKSEEEIRKEFAAATRDTKERNQERATEYIQELLTIARNHWRGEANTIEIQEAGLGK